MSRFEVVEPGSRVSAAAMRRLTLTRMLIWAAREAREIDCAASASHIDSALDEIAAGIGRKGDIPVASGPERSRF